MRGGGVHQDQGAEVGVEGAGQGAKVICVQVLAALLHALPLKEDLEEWVTIGHLFSFLHQSSPDQVTPVLGCSMLQSQWRAELTSV